jgi:hypothetical protein
VIYFILTALIFIHQVRGKKGTLTSESNLLDQNYQHFLLMENNSLQERSMDFVARMAAYVEIFASREVRWRWGRERNGSPSLLSTKYCRMVQNGTLTIV